MDSMTDVEEYREFLEYFKAHVDPNDQLPVRVPGYNLLESEIDGEVINWVLQYLLQMKCPQVLLAPIINEAVHETKKSYTKIPKQCGFDGYAYNPLKLSAIVISHTNGICERLLDNAELNEMLTKSSVSVLSHTPRHCVKAIKNTRRKMEDRHVCISDFNGMFAIKDSEPTSFYGVFDGHGGQDAAFFTAAHLCYNIAKSSKYPHNIDEAIRESFLKTDAAFIDKSDKHALYCGTTALACLYRAAEKRLFVGWVGDSQALLVCEGKVCQIVSPHVPSLESERKRIEKMGGVVLNWNGSYRVNGQLAVSRAIGDAQLKPFITGEPDTSTISLEGTEDFLIIASDGLWESLTEDYIALFIYRKIAENPDCADSIADKLVESARKGTTDNITIVVVFFKDPHLIAKSSWLNKMEAAYDKNNSNSAFDNDSTHFKFSNADGGFNISPDMPVSNESEECQVISPPTIVKNCYNESNDVHITDESVDVVDNHQRFEDDFGPETDVDAMDETTFIKSPVEPQANDNNNEFSLSNGIKPFSLENKIIQQLSEQNRDFLTDSNPFKNDHFDQYSDDHALLDQITKASDESSAEVVDNKIIDALESLAVSNGENEKHELEDGKQEGDLLDIRQQSPDIPDLTEKADYVHEKNLFILDSAAKPDDTFMQHSDNTFNQAENQNASLIEQDDTPSLAETRCVDESVGEDSEEEEDEWNYIKGDKKSEEKQNPSAAELDAGSAQSPEIQSSESVIEVVDTTVSNLASEPELLDFTSGETVQKEEEEEALGENEKIDETKDDIVETAESIAKPEEPVREALEEQPEDTAVSIEQELADYENNFSTIASSEVALCSENTDPVPFDEKLNLDTAPNLLLEETSPSELVTECSLSSEIAAENEQPSTEVVVEDHPSADIGAEEAPSKETVAEHTSSMNIVKENTLPKEIVVEEAPVEKQTTEEQLSDIVPETSVDEELERPDSLSLEMASKLNPEAKEFVPVSSPTRSNPTSPVANAPGMVPNSFLMLDDDTVVAQSPKKFTTTMDNIDVPAEDDFQHEMNNRPHELEKPLEYVNGNADVSARSHSPVSEPSYQELNLKEAMQADEKLEHDYNDEKQVVTEDSPSDIPNEQNILNVLNKDQDPMNMSFYEGRDEALLSNSDELNKVHMLPEVEDEIEEQSTDDTDKVQADMHELTPTEAKHENLLEDKMEITESEIKLQPSCEEEVQSKSPASEEPSAAIYAVASQVVNDVAALVDQMQIESPLINDDDLKHGEELHLEVPVEMPIEITADDTKLEENRDILISLEHQNENKPLEDAIDIGLRTETPSPNPVENLHAVETEDLISPLVESLQQEVVAENEFITDESVLNVQSPSQTLFSSEAPTAPELVLEEPIKEPMTTETTENLVEPVAELVETATTPNLLETVTPVLEQVAAVSDADKVVEELKPVVAEMKTATTKPTAKSTTSTKPTASKTTTAKSAKPAAPTAEKKTTTAAKLSAKPATTKPSATSKPPTTSTVKKTSTVSSAPSTRTVGAAKPPSSSTIGRSSTAGSATNKLSTEKKAPLPIKKPATTAVNGEVKAAPAARKPTTTTTTLKSTTNAKSSLTSSGSVTSAKPSSTSVRSTTARPSSATTKSTTSVSARSSTTATARTSSTVPTAKPRTVPAAASKTASSSTTTTTTVASKSSSNAITKRFSTVGPAAPKTTTATTTTKTTTAVKATNPAANRTSTVSKLSSTTGTGVRKTTTASPTKKPVSSPATKTTPSSVKAPASMKIVGSNHANDKVSTEVATTTDLLDLDKQFKNDNNQFITKNGIDSQMMVIDSAAD